MTKKREKNMIHEALKSGRCITQAEGHGQELIMALMSLKGILGDIDHFHTYLVIART
jgi:hypothetical protein